MPDIPEYRTPEKYINAVDKIPGISKKRAERLKQIIQFRDRDFLSYRDIAKKTGVSHEQINLDLKLLSKKFKKMGKEYGMFAEWINKPGELRKKEMHYQTFPRAFKTDEQARQANLTRSAIAHLRTHFGLGETQISQVHGISVQTGVSSIIRKMEKDKTLPPGAKARFKEVRDLKRKEMGGGTKDFRIRKRYESGWERSKKQADARALEAYRLQYQENKKTAEIAELMRVPRTTVDNLLRRAKGLLNPELKEQLLRKKYDGLIKKRGKERHQITHETSQNIFTVLGLRQQGKTTKQIAIALKKSNSQTKNLLGIGEKYLQYKPWKKLQETKKKMERKLKSRALARRV